MVDIEATGELALAEMKRLFALDVYDPPRGDDSLSAQLSRQVISEILKTCGWTWSEVYPYDHDGQVEWCVLTAGHAWAKAGLDPKWLTAFFGSTMRLYNWGTYQPWNEHFNPKPSGLPTSEWRQLRLFNAQSNGADSFNPRPGDIATIGDGDPIYGDHCVVIESFDPKTQTFTHYSGNGVGIGPDGHRRQGIVRGQSRVGGPGYCLRMLVRPSPHDIIQ